MVVGQHHIVVDGVVHEELGGVELLCRTITSGKEQSMTNDLLASQNHLLGWAPIIHRLQRFPNPGILLVVLSIVGVEKFRWSGS